MNTNDIPRSEISKKKMLSRDELKKKYQLGERILLIFGIIGLVLLSTSLIPLLQNTTLEEISSDSKIDSEMLNVPNETPPIVDKTPSPQSISNNNPVYHIDSTIKINNGAENNNTTESLINDEGTRSKIDASNQSKNDSGDLIKEENSKKYYLIAGSFDNKKNAESLIEQLKEKGYHPIILPKNGNSFKVAVSILLNRKEADEQKSKLLKNGFETWILYQ